MTIIKTKKITLKILKASFIAFCFNSLAMERSDRSDRSQEYSRSYGSYGSYGSCGSYASIPSFQEVFQENSKEYAEAKAKFETEFIDRKPEHLRLSTAFGFLFNSQSAHAELIGWLKANIEKYKDYINDKIYHKINNEFTESDATPLNLAINYNSPEIVRILLANGAIINYRPDKQDKHGKKLVSLLEIARRLKNKEIVAILEEHEKKIKKHEK